MNHFHLIFGYRCDIFARVLYIKLAKRKDHAKINFVEFAEAFLGLLHEVKDKRSRAVFNLLEFNGDGEYDIMYLFQLLVNVPRNTMFGQEVLKLTKEYKDKNVLKKGGFTSQIKLNFQTFNALIPCSCLIDELQYKILGTYVPEKRATQFTKEERALLKERHEFNKNRDFTNPNEVLSIEEMLRDRNGLDADMKVPPPRRNPFQVIDNLEEIIRREQEEQDKREGNFNKNKFKE